VRCEEPHNLHSSPNISMINLRETRQEGRGGAGHSKYEKSIQSCGRKS
jgi:hypothetical protein